MPYFTYVLFSQSSGHFYIGQTPDVEKRLKEHNVISTHSYTRLYRPWILYAFIEFRTRSSAMKTEKYLKKKPRDFLMRLADDEALKDFIKSKFEVG